MALAVRGATYLRTHLVPGQVVDPFVIVDHVGRAYAAARNAQGHGAPAKRDPNVTGAAFEVTLQVLLDHVADVRARYPDPALPPTGLRVNNPPYGHALASRVQRWRQPSGVRAPSTTRGC